MSFTISLICQLGLGIGLVSLLTTLPLQAQEAATLALTNGERPSGDLLDLNGSGFWLRVNGQDRAFPVAQVSVVEFVHLWNPVTDPAPVQAGGKGIVSVPVSTRDERLDLELKADYVHARDRQTGDPLPRISPFHASAALDYHRGPFGARLEGIWSASQHDVADNELPTDSYFMVNAALTYTLHSGSTTTELFLKGVNLTDEEAREHTSFLKDIAPLGGRGVVAGVKVSF